MLWQRIKYRKSGSFLFENKENNLNFYAKVYYPFGSPMVGRGWEAGNTGDYRFGMNGQEEDDEIYGDGNSTSAEFWQYDARLGRRWNVDPVTKEYESPYSCFGNNPILIIDINGADSTIYVSKQNYNGKHEIDDSDLKKFNKSLKEMLKKNKLEFYKIEYVDQKKEDLDPTDINLIIYFKADNSEYGKSTDANNAYVNIYKFSMRKTFNGWILENEARVINNFRGMARSASHEIVHCLFKKIAADFLFNPIKDLGAIDEQGHFNKPNNLLTDANHVMQRPTDLDSKTAFNPDEILLNWQLGLIKGWLSYKPYLNSCNEKERKDMGKYYLNKAKRKKDANKHVSK